MLIFLDIDGVMVPAKGWQRPELLSDGFPVFSLNAVNALKKLITKGTTIILTTSHKSRYNVKEWKAIFSKRGLNNFKLEKLNENIDNLNRKEEVINWFASNKLPTEFIIIDDDTSLNDLPLYLKEKLILTKPLIGLNERDIEGLGYLLSRNLHKV
jgi:hypothetical protein